jgi:Pyruvate/2-oxoacid:ferredoxin oxidoreductase gamma subunit
MEREVLMTGIGGQGVQLAARTLALAALHEGREAMFFGAYGGAMRGGPTEATVVVGDEPLQTPPTVDHAWSALAMHHEFWPHTRDRIVAGGVAVLDTSVFRGEIGLVDCSIVQIPATTIATETGKPHAGAMVALGAFAAATGLVSIDSLAATAYEVLPPYRAKHAEDNATALRTGYDFVPDGLAHAWSLTQEPAI